MFESHLDSLSHRAQLPPGEARVLERLMSRVYQQEPGAFQVPSENLVRYLASLPLEGPEQDLVEKLKAAYGVSG